MNLIVLILRSSLVLSDVFCLPCVCVFSIYVTNLVYLQVLQDNLIAFFVISRMIKFILL